MTIQLLFFGITTDLIGNSSATFTLPEACSVALFKVLLIEKYPQLQNNSSFAIAVNESYATENEVIKEGDVVAIIPPVSGG